MKTKPVKTPYEKVMSLLNGMTASEAKNLLNAVLHDLDNHTKVVPKRLIKEP